MTTLSLPRSDSPLETIGNAFTTEGTEEYTQRNTETCVPFSLPSVCLPSVNFVVKKIRMACWARVEINGICKVGCAKRASHVGRDVKPISYPKVQRGWCR
jgi:hypothetical protein